MIVRNATNHDIQALANLIHFEVFVHRHLDWRPPLDWIGHQPFLVAEQSGNIVAALACSPDIPSAAWIRLFAATASLDVNDAWNLLWENALAILKDNGTQWVAAMPLHEWLISLLLKNGFMNVYQVVMLSWEIGEIPKASPKLPVNIRPMLNEDLGSVQQVDQESFVPVWQNSINSLALAFNQSAVATVAEIDHEILGYQISTATPMGGHLARFAIHPKAQKKGVGFALLCDLLSHFVLRGARTVTVNTQKDNKASRRLYENAGFQLTEEEYPIFELSLYK